MSQDFLPPTIIISIPTGTSNVNIKNSAGIFYRTDLNSNIEISVPIGVNNGGIHTSADIYLPSSIYNTIKSSDAILIDDPSVNVLAGQSCTHDISIHYKLLQSDGFNFVNQRSLYCTLVDTNGIEYDPSIAAQQQPDTGSHSYITIKGVIDHAINDVVQIKMILSQDERLDGQNDSLIVIFGISWNMSSLI
jgi:hypothetical protein